MFIQILTQLTFHDRTALVDVISDTNKLVGARGTKYELNIFHPVAYLKENLSRRAKIERYSLPQTYYSICNLVACERAQTNLWRTRMKSCFLQGIDYTYNNRVLHTSNHLDSDSLRSIGKPRISPTLVVGILGLKHR